MSREISTRVDKVEDISPARGTEFDLKGIYGKLIATWCKPTIHFLLLSGTARVPYYCTVVTCVSVGCEIDKPRSTHIHPSAVEGRGKKKKV